MMMARCRGRRERSRDEDDEIFKDFLF